MKQSLNGYDVNFQKLKYINSLAFCRLRIAYSEMAERTMATIHVGLRRAIISSEFLKNKARNKKAIMW